MDPIQLLLNIVLTVSTILLVIVGIQLIFILKELRKTLKKINEIIVAFEKFGGSLGYGFSEVLGFFAAIKSLIKVFDILRRKKNGKSSET